jgi:nitrite reductase (NO-forming)
VDRLLIGAFYITNFVRIDVDLKERNKTASRDGIMKKGISSFLLLAALGLDSTVLFWNSSAPRAESQARIDAQLLSPPEVPPPITRRNPATVVVQLESFEKRGQLAEVEYEFWIFGDSVPGPLIRVREGDMVELHFKNNAASKFPHSIDLHAVTGPGGGAKITQTAPGQEKAFVWKALNPGLFVYHCATPMVSHHIANGTYGMILVEPKGGLPRVDRESFTRCTGNFTAKGSWEGKGSRISLSTRCLENTLST